MSLPVVDESLRFAGQLGLGVARTVPLAWLLPALGGASLPKSIRLAIGIGLALLCWPMLTSQPIAGSAVALAVLFAREVLVGMVMGLVCSCYFHAAGGAGRLADDLRVIRVEAVASPVTSEQSGPMGVLMLLTSVVVFFEIGGLDTVAVGLVRSYEAIPLGSITVAPGWLGHAATVVILASANLIEATIALCAPIIVATITADLLLGILGRIVPGVPLRSMSGVARPVVVVLVLLLAFAGIRVALARSWASWLALFLASGRP
jgi:flagellar biosynthetic protein FliR